MRIDHHHHIEVSPEVNQHLYAFQHKLDLIIRRTAEMAKTLQDIIDQGNAALTQIARNTDLDNSIIALQKASAQTITDLRAQLTAAGTDPAKLAELGDVMDQIATKTAAEGQIVADAVTAGT